MQCHEFTDVLSSYFDGELAEEKRAEVATHLSGCSSCQTDLAGFQQLSGMAQALDTPTPPEDGWQRIEEQLEKQPARSTAKWWTSSTTQVAFALTIVFAITLGRFVFRGSDGDHSDHFTHEFGQYLNRFHSDPESAQEYLLGLYESKKVDPEAAIQTVGYRPAVADGLPQGYTAQATHVINMLCCKCVQTICKRDDGSSVALFEHDDEETDEWFGDRPEINIRNGKSCCMVETNHQVAATWKRGKTLPHVGGHSRCGGGNTDDCLDGSRSNQ